MSTRCQVQVVEIGMGWDERVTLYHHTDGYPTYMLPMISKARNLAGNSWESGRAGKVASFLCAADPGVFEPEEGHQPHGDIEWFYRIVLENKTGGSAAEKPRWFVEVYSSIPDDVFPEGGERIPLEQAIQQAKILQDRGIE